MSFQSIICTQASTNTAEIVSIVVVVLLAIFIPTFLILRKKSRLKCPECKTKFSYKDIVKAQEGSTSVMNGIGLATTDVHVWCKCPKCGKIKEFTVKFKSGERTEGVFGSKVKVFDLDEKLRDYFK